MAFPQPNEYNEAIQNLRSTMSDAELREGEAAANPMGMPMPSSGNFADVYKVHCPATGNTWAVKCFTREVAGLKERYRGISEHLEKVPFGFMVEFHYVEPGIRIGKQSYPFLKMRWVEGLRLNQFVCDYLDKPKTLHNLLPLWLRLLDKLRKAKIAHGDLQHGNVLLVPVPETGQLSLKLIDYDGMYVPALAKTKSGEVGHPGFQHPQRIKEAIYNADVDRFSHLAIYTAIQALIAGKRELWDKFDNGDNLLFRESDFKDPAASELFRRLWETPSRPELHSLAGRLILACTRPLNQCPHLDELVFNGVVLPLTPELEEKVRAMLGAAGPAAQAPSFNPSLGGMLAAPPIQAPAASSPGGVTPTVPAALTYPLAAPGLADLLNEVPTPLPAVQIPVFRPRKRFRLKKLGVLAWVAASLAMLGFVAVVGTLAYLGGAASRENSSSVSLSAILPSTPGPEASGSAVLGTAPSPPSEPAAIPPSGKNNPRADMALLPGSLPATAPPLVASNASPANSTLPGNGALFSRILGGWTCSGFHDVCRVNLKFVYSGPPGVTYNLVVERTDGARKVSPFIPTPGSATFTAVFTGWGVDDGPFRLTVENASGNCVAVAREMPTFPSSRPRPSGDSGASRVAAGRGIAFDSQAKPRGIRTRLIGDSGGMSVDSIGDGSSVLGFSYQFGQWAGKPAIQDLAPIYDREDQSEKPATAPRPTRNRRMRSGMNPGAQQVLARKGYAVGALEVKTNPYVAAVRVVFMRLGDDGRLNTEDAYKSAWIGQAVGSAQTVGGDGRKVIGVHGRRGLILNAVGLVLERPAELPESE